MARIWSGITSRYSWFRMFLSAHGYGAVLLGCVTVFCTVVSLHQFAQARTVAQDGVKMFALVVERRVAGPELDREYFVTYQVTIDDQKQQVERQVSGSQYRDARLFMQEIRFPTDNADLIANQEARFRAEGRQYQTYAFWAGFFGLIWGCFSGHTATAALLARRWGVEEDAYVTDRVVSYSSKSLPKVHIRFRSHSGCEGQSFTRSSLTFPDVDRGEYIRVFVHRGRAWWTHDIGTRPKLKARMPAVQRMRKALRLFGTRHQS